VSVSPDPLGPFAPQLAASLSPYIACVVITVGCWLYIELTDPSAPNTGIPCGCMARTQATSAYCSLCRKTVPGLGESEVGRAVARCCRALAVRLSRRVCNPRPRPAADHHCYFLNTCISKRNYFFFFTMSTVATLQMVLHVVVSVLGMTVWLDPRHTGAEYFVLVSVQGTIAAAAGAGTVSLCSFHVYLLWLGMGTYDWMWHKEDVAKAKAKERARKEFDRRQEEALRDQERMRKEDEEAGVVDAKAGGGEAGIRVRSEPAWGAGEDGASAVPPVPPRRSAVASGVDGTATSAAGVGPAGAGAADGAGGGGGLYAGFGGGAYEDEETEGGFGPADDALGGADEDGEAVPGPADATLSLAPGLGSRGAASGGAEESKDADEDAEAEADEAEADEAEADEAEADEAEADEEEADEAEAEQGQDHAHSDEDGDGRAAAEEEDGEAGPGTGEGSPAPAGEGETAAGDATSEREVTEGSEDGSASPGASAVQVRAAARSAGNGGTASLEPASGETSPAAAPPGARRASDDAEA